MLEKLSKRQISLLSIFGAVALWGIATPIIKVTIENIPPFSFLMLRFWISAIFILPFVIKYLKRVKLDKKRLKYLIIAGLLGQVLALTFYFQGLERAQVTEAAIISTLAPLFTCLMGYYFLKEIITRKELEGTLIAFIGAIVIIIEPILTGHSIFNGGRVQVIGNLLFIIGVIFDSAYPIYTKKYLSHDALVSPFFQIAFAMILAAIVFTPLAFVEQIKLSHTSHNNLPVCEYNNIDNTTQNAFVTCNDSGCFVADYRYVCKFENSKADFNNNIRTNFVDYLTSKTLYGILYMALISGLAAYFLYIYGLKEIDASEASVFYYAQPLISIPLSIIFLGESISAVFILGAIIIAIGIYLVEKKR